MWFVISLCNKLKGIKNGETCHNTHAFPDVFITYVTQITITSYFTIVINTENYK